MKKGQLTHWAFLLGAIISVLVGVLAALQSSFAANKWIPVVLVILGLIVGFVNVTSKEVVGFLVAAIVIMVASVSVLAVLGMNGLPNSQQPMPTQTLSPTASSSSTT